MKNLLFITLSCLSLFAANGQAQNNVIVGLSPPQGGFTTVDHSEMYLPPPFGAPTDWTPLPPPTPEELLQRQQMEAMERQIEEALMKAPIRGAARAIWNGQGANLMTYAGIADNPYFATAWGISEEQLGQIGDRMYATAEQMTDPMEAEMFKVVEEMNMKMQDGWEPDMETMMRMQTEAASVMENTLETMSTIMNTAIADAFDEFLTPEQLRMIQESQLANIGELPAFSPSIFEALDLTDAQREQMEQIKRELEPEFEETLDSWVDGFLATQKMVDEAWSK